jgi:hypothetical protein
LQQASPPIQHLRLSRAGRTRHKTAFKVPDKAGVGYHPLATDQSHETVSPEPQKGIESRRVSLSSAQKTLRPVQLAMGVSQREDGTNGNNGTNGSSQTVFKPFPFVPYSLDCSEFQSPIAQVETLQNSRLVDRFKSNPPTFGSHFPFRHFPF